MSSERAPSQRNLWSWLEKDISNTGLQQKHNKQLLPIDDRTMKNKIPNSKNDHRKAKKKKKNPNQTKSVSKQIYFNEKIQTNRMLNYVTVTDMEGNKIDKEDTIEDPEYFGEQHTQKADGTLRIWFTNPCGIGIRHDDIKSYDSFKFLCKKSRCDIFGLAETNVQWHKLRGAATFYSRVKQSWKNFRTITCHNTHEDLGINQRGGNCMAVTGQATIRMTKSGRDHANLGRWVWMEFSGKEAYSTRIYTAYRPSAHKPPHSKNTTVYDQHDRYIRKNKLSSTPRELFDTDLKREIKDHLHNKQIILMLDANEDIENGTFNDMMNGLGMRNGIQSRIAQPMPPTHHRGSRPISAIYCSRNIIVMRSGILPIGMGIRGDHRNIYIDVQAQSVMGGKMFMITPPPMRTLKLNDSRVYLRFIKLVKNHLIANKTMEKAQQLYNNSTYPATSQMIRMMEEIDEQMGRAIRTGLRKCRTIHSGAIPFSALFRNLSRTNRLWLLVLKKKKGQKISNTTIRRLSKQVGITKPLCYHIDEIILRLRESKRRYEMFIPHAPTERRKFFEDLASANAAVSNQKKLTILKNIMQTESSREQHAIIRKVFPKKISASTKVDRVQVQRGEVWEEVSTPNELVKALQSENKEKYSCTNGTPLMQKQIHEQMGNFAQGKLAKDIQYGHVEPNKLFDEWTSEMLSATKMDPKIPRIPIEITPSELEDAWRLSKENKAASPSGRYNATYKAMCKDKDLLNILTMQINLPFKMGEPYRRWSTFLDIMAFKKAHSTKINTLRSIIISEGDWNVAGRIYVTRKLMQQAEKLDLLPEEHLGGRKNRKSIDGAITKRLFLDNSRMLNKPAIILSTDAANCYDRMVHKFICMICKKWGLEENVLKALLKPLQTAKHFTRTAYGDSSSSFTGRDLQGAGQGNTSAAPFWTCVSSPMIDIMKQKGFQSKMQCPFSLEEILLTLMAFVDDTEVFLTVDSDDIDELLEMAHTTLKSWKKVLQATGGDMRSKKCAWILLQYGTRKRTHDSYRMTIEDEDGITRSIQRYRENEPREYLGVLQQASGVDTAQLEILNDKVEKWNEKMEKSKLYNAYNCSAVFTRIHKSLQYPLPATTISEKDLQNLSNKLYETCLPKCGINRKFPLDFRDLPYKYQGLSLPNLYLHQETNKLIEILSTNSTNHIMWKQYKLGLEILQLKTGVSECVLNCDYSKFSQYVDQTWITTQWEFMWTNELTIKGWDHKIEKQRENDKGLMATFISAGYGSDKLRTLNECRMYLNAIMISDVVDGDGTHLCPMALEGQLNEGQTSKFKWPSTRKPNISAWCIWKDALKQTLCSSSIHTKLAIVLGAWNSTTHHEWNWHHHEETGYLYHKVEKHYRVYRPSTRRSMHLRKPVRLFKAISLIEHDQLPRNCARASAQREGIGYTYVKFYGSCKIVPSKEKTAHEDEIYVGAISFKKSQDWMCSSTNLASISKEKLHAIMNEPIRIVADGSFKKDHSSMAVIIEPASQSHQIIVAGPVPANISSPTHSTDPYRSEMAGLLAGITVLKKMEKLTQKTTAITLSCDNDSALQVATSYSYFNARMKHHDVARSLIQSRKDVESSITAEKVMGHAEDRKIKRKLTRTELLNQSCDRLAKQARIAFRPIGNRSLDDEGLSLWHNTCKINHDVKQHIQHIYMHKKAGRIICEKYKWNDTQFQQVDWEANAKAMSMLSIPTRTWIAKFVSKFLPIGRNMQRMHKWTMNHCPRCRAAEETHDHLLQCKHVPSYELLQVQLSKLRDWMVKMRTPEDLEIQIMFNIEKYLNLPSTNIIIPHHTIQEQRLLGTWDHFMQGRIHSSFSQHMSNIYESIGDTRKSGQMWTAGLIQRIWTLLYKPIWELRNKYVHESINALKMTRNREELMRKVKIMYNEISPLSLLAQDRHLFEITLPHLLSSTQMSQKAWLLSVEIAIKERDAAGERDVIESNMILRKWMNTNRLSSDRRDRGNKDQRIGRKKRVNVKPRRQLQHSFTQRIWKKRVNGRPRPQLRHAYRQKTESPRNMFGSLKSDSLELLHRTGFFKPP